MRASFRARAVSPARKGPYPRASRAFRRGRRAFCLFRAGALFCRALGRARRGKAGDRCARGGFPGYLRYGRVFDGARYRPGASGREVPHRLLRYGKFHRAYAGRRAYDPGKAAPGTGAQRTERGHICRAGGIPARHGDRRAGGHRSLALFVSLCAEGALPRRRRDLQKRISAGCTAVSHGAPHRRQDRPLRRRRALLRSRRRGSCACCGGVRHAHRLPHGLSFPSDRAAAVGGRGEPAGAAALCGDDRLYPLGDARGGHAALSPVCAALRAGERRRNVAFDGALAPAASQSFRLRERQPAIELFLRGGHLAPFRADVPRAPPEDRRDAHGPTPARPAFPPFRRGLGFKQRRRYGALRAAHGSALRLGVGRVADIEHPLSVDRFGGLHRRVHACGARRASPRRRGAGRKRSRVGRAVYLRGVRLPLAAAVRECICAKSAFPRLARARICDLLRRVAVLPENRTLPCACAGGAFARAALCRRRHYAPWLERFASSYGARRRAGRMHRAHERRTRRGGRLRRKLGHARRREKRRAVSRGRMPEERRCAHSHSPPRRPRQRRGAALAACTRRYALSAA